MRADELEERKGEVIDSRGKSYEVRGERERWCGLK
jgi:hypothetical protein